MALSRIGIDSMLAALVARDAGRGCSWRSALMCASMLLRAEAWHAILRAALPGVRVRRRDVARGTMIGVLMSATLPARLGEPSRALIVAARLGRVRERLPVVLGTIVSQTLLNIVALCVLGAIMFATVGLFRGNESALLVVTIAPFAVLIALCSPCRRCCAAASRRASCASSARRPRCANAMVQRALRPRGVPPPEARRLGRGQPARAWALQWLACYALLVALGLDHEAGSPPPPRCCSR